MTASAASPGRPVVVAPASWFVREALEFTAADLRAHVLATSEPVKPGTTLDEFADAYGRLLRRTLAEYDELSVDRTTFSGQEAVVRRLEWTPVGGRRVTQLQIYALDGEQAYIATATTQTVCFERMESRLKELLSSISAAGEGATAIPSIDDAPGRPEARALEEFERGTTDAVAAPSPTGDWSDCVSAWSDLRARFSEL